MTQDKRISLQAYVAQLQQRLSAPIPEKHKDRVEAYKQMLEIDLKKTLAKLNK